VQALLVNAVVEEYDSGIWHVIKYANGKVECWGHNTLNVAFKDAGPYGGYMSPVLTVTYPFVPTEPPVAYISGDTTNQIIVTFVIPRLTEITYRIYNSAPCNGTAALNYYVVGKWK
jgi:hypothetical protein